MRTNAPGSLRTRVLAALIALLPHAIGGCDASMQSKPPLLETRWMLQTLGGEAVSVEGEEAVPYLELRVAEAGALASGHSGCNRFSGGFESDDASLRIGALASTRMACPGGAMELESRFLQALGQVSEYRIQGDRLTLTGPDGEVAGFQVADSAEKDGG